MCIYYKRPVWGRDLTPGVDRMLDQKNEADLKDLGHVDGPRGVVDGLVVGDRETWVVLAPQDEPLGAWFEQSAEWGSIPLVICRDVIGGEVVVIDTPDPLQGRLLSDLEELL